MKGAIAKDEELMAGAESPACRAAFAPPRSHHQAVSRDVSMPDELANHLSRLSFRSRGAAIGTWYAIGEEGRAHYREFVSSPRLGRARRKRAERVMKQLLDPPTGPQAPFIVLPRESAEPSTEASPQP